MARHREDITSKDVDKFNEHWLNRIFPIEEMIILSTLVRGQDVF